MFKSAVLRFVSRKDLLSENNSSLDENLEK